MSNVEAGRGAAARGVTVKPTGCGFNPHSRRLNIYLNLYFHFFPLVSRLSAALSSATQHAMPPEFGRKWRTECLNIKFPLPTLLYEGYSVKLIYLWFILFIISTYLYIVTGSSEDEQRLSWNTFLISERQVLARISRWEWRRTCLAGLGTSNEWLMKEWQKSFMMEKW